MHHHESQEARSMMVDIDREQAYWRANYRRLPKASSVRSFVRYWPLMVPAYDAYLRQPHASMLTLLKSYLGSGGVARVLRPPEATFVFAQIWQRITGVPAHGLHDPDSRRADVPFVTDTPTP